MNWRNDKPTYKQLNLIKDIEDEFGEKFTGTTKKDASEYIDKWLKAARQDIGLINERYITANEMIEGLISEGYTSLKGEKQ